LLALLVLATAVPGGFYLAGFVCDARGPTTRILAADRIAQFHERGATTLAVYAEPAPYAVPPVNLFRWRVLLLPPGYVLNNETAPADVVVRAVDALRAPVVPRVSLYDWGLRGQAASLVESPMRWAAKPFLWLVKKQFVVPASRRSSSDAP